MGKRRASVVMCRRLLVSRCSPFVVVLSDVDRAVLEGRVRGYSAPFAVVVRARIVLLAARV